VNTANYSIVSYGLEVDRFQRGLVDVTATDPHEMSFCLPTRIGRVESVGMCRFDVVLGTRFHRTSSA
jgi:hypothetical protein